MTSTRCLHELDTVRLERPLVGWREPDGEEVTVPAGTQGTVVLHHGGADWVQVEVVEDDGWASVTLSAPNEDLSLLRRYVPTG